MAYTGWQKAYKGPFSRKEGEIIAGQLRAIANPRLNGIADARVWKRSFTNKVDVYIKVI